MIQYRRALVVYPGAAAAVRSASAADERARPVGNPADTIPSEAPYLAAPKYSGAALEKALEQALGREKIGIVWAGNPAQKNDHNRSFGRAHLSSLADYPDVALFNLQKDASPAVLSQLH